MINNKLRDTLLIFLSLPMVVFAQKKTTSNIILILVDDLGINDVGCYGNKIIHTPNIDKLAEQGMRWQNAYSSCPVSSPTRAALLTGKTPARLHFTGHVTAIEKHRHPENSVILPPNDLMYIPLEEITIPEMLKPYGYISANIGKWHVGMKGFWPENQGFDVNIGGWTHGSPPSHFFPYKDPKSSWNPEIPNLKGGKIGEYLTDRLTDETIQFIKNNKEKPFFTYLSYYAVHTPLEAPDSLVKKYIPLVANTKINPIYAAMVESVDSNVGRIMKLLEELSLSKSTIVIFASDNGGLEDVTDNGPYKRGKGHLYEGGIRVPLIMRWPGKIKPGTISQNRTISTDIFHTIKDITTEGKIIKDTEDGRSIVSDFNENQRLKKRDLYWYYPHYGIGQDPGSIIISGDYKLIEHYDPYHFELFNITKDSSEQKNLIDKMPQKAEELKTKLHNWLNITKPILHTPNPGFKSNI
jgi:arylsulfatase A